MPPGTVSGVDGDALLVNTGDGVLRLERLQLPGRKPVSGREFANARRSTRCASARRRMNRNAQGGGSRALAAAAVHGYCTKAAISTRRSMQPVKLRWTRVIARLSGRCVSVLCVRTCATVT